MWNSPVRGAFSPSQPLDSGGGVAGGEGADIVGGRRGGGPSVDVGSSTPSCACGYDCGSAGGGAGIPHVPTGDGSAGDAHDPTRSARQEVEDEFSRRLEELQQWRFQALSSLSLARQYRVGLNQFHVEGGRTACTAVCISAAACVLKDVASNFAIMNAEEAMPHLAWENIVRTGVGVWEEYMESYHARENVDGFVSCKDILEHGSYRCMVMQQNLEVVGEAAGHTDDASVAFMDEESDAKRLDEALPAESCMATIFTAIHGDNNNAGGSTVAVFRLSSRTEGYWIFDSHGGADTGHAALLVHCTTPEDTVHALRQRLPQGLFSCTHFKRKVSR